jgi:hypothetical protein
MFNVLHPKSVLALDQAFIDNLPEKEAAELEYKSSDTPDGKLGDKISKAASAFWNSGGGLCVAGVSDETGKVDGGISTVLGKQDRRAWIDQYVMKTHPIGPYEVKPVPQTVVGGMDKAVYLIGFGASVQMPHMAIDNRYYVRAGVHSLPAPHGIVEALRSY